MSRNETRALIERYFDAFNAGERESLLTCLSEDVAHDIGADERQIGRDGFRWRLADEARHFREEVSDLEIMTSETGGRAAAEYTLRGTYLARAEGLPEADGQRYTVAGGAFFDIDGGLITRVSQCCAAARRAAALAEG